MPSDASSKPVRGAALVEHRLGYRFAERALFERALTHRSFGADHNERLEFLGDAVLSLAVSRLLFDRFSGSDEGDLTRVRAHLVREDSLHKVALVLGLPDALKLSEGEARGGGAARPSILADAVEALLATGDARSLATARKRFMRAHGRVFWVLGIMQTFWYSSDRRRERFVSICRDRDVQKLTFDAYMNKELVRSKPMAHVRIFFKDLAHLVGLVAP